MKQINLNRLILATGIALGGLAFNLGAQASVNVFVEGGSASESVLYDRATNLFAGGSFTSTGTGSSTVREFVGTSLNTNLSGYGNITLDINVANGAIAGLQSLVNQSPGPGDTNVFGTGVVPTFVDSATSPDAVGISSSANNLVGLPTYVVPLVYVKDTNFAALSGITNLTQQQAVTLETSTNPANFFGSSSTNTVYFVGRNSQSAVRTEVDLNIYNSLAIETFTNNTAGQPVQDTSPDPGLSSASALVSVVEALTNSLGELAVQNVKSPLVPLAFNGINYSVTNVENGSYALWGYENYYQIQTGFTGAPTGPQQAVINALYQSVTNSAFQSNTNPVFGSNYVPIPALLVTRSYDGGPIVPKANY